MGTRSRKRAAATENVNRVHKTGRFFAFRGGVIVKFEPADEVINMRPTFVVILSLAFTAPAVARADTLLIEGLEKAQPTMAERPARGMTMDRVSAAWGAPVSKGAAVGQPPITRWEYPDFVVFFEYDHVIHAVAKRS